MMLRFLLGLALAITPAPAPATALALPPASDDRPDDPRAAELLARLDGDLFAESFLMSGRLSIERDGEQREVLLRVHHLAPDRTLVRAAGNGRHRGTTYLLHPGGLAAWFPRADLLLELPAGAAGQRLFGSDLSLEDLGLLMGQRERFRAEWLGERELEGDSTIALSLLPRSPGLSLYARVELWVRVSDAAPLRMAAFDRHGELLRSLHFSEHEERSPRRWLAEDGRGTSRSVLRIGQLETEVRHDPERFDLEGLRTWR